MTFLEPVRDLRATNYLGTPGKMSPRRQGIGTETHMAERYEKKRHPVPYKWLKITDLFFK